MRRSLFTLAIALLSLPSYSQKSKGDVYYQQAKDLLDGGDSKKAVKIFLNAREEYLKENNYYRYFVATQSVSIIFQDASEGKAAEKLILETNSVIP